MIYLFGFQIMRQFVVQSFKTICYALMVLFDFIKFFLFVEFLFSHGDVDVFEVIPHIF